MDEDEEKTCGRPCSHVSDDATATAGCAGVSLHSIFEAVLLYKYIHMCVCEYKCFLEQTVENVFYILSICPLEYVL